MLVQVLYKSEIIEQVVHMYFAILLLMSQSGCKNLKHNNIDNAILLLINKWLVFVSGLTKAAIINMEVF